MGSKLIRDKVPNLPWSDEEGKKFIRKVRDEDEALALAMAKVFEEIGELYASVVDNDDAMLEEFADVYTALLNLLKASAFAFEDLINKYEEKLESHGGFEEGWVWDRSKYMGG